MFVFSMLSGMIKKILAFMNNAYMEYIVCSAICILLSIVPVIVYKKTISKISYKKDVKI
jgi:hypothetical protein